MTQAIPKDEGAGERMTFSERESGLPTLTGGRAPSGRSRKWFLTNHVAERHISQRSRELRGSSLLAYPRLPTDSRGLLDCWDLETSWLRGLRALIVAYRLDSLSKWNGDLAHTAPP